MAKPKKPAAKAAPKPAANPVAALAKPITNSSGGQKKLNRRAAKAAADGSISGKEAKALLKAATNSGANASLSIAKQGAKGALISNNAQANAGLKISGNGMVTYDPRAVKSQMNLTDRYMTHLGIINKALDPMQAKLPQFVQNTAGQYTFLGGKAVPIPNAMPQRGGGAGTGGAGGGIGDWEQSVNNSNQALIDSINQQIAANKSQADLYMGQIADLMNSMKNTNLQSIVPYSTTTTLAPAVPTQTTQAITARSKLLDDLSGSGLNIAI